MFKKIFSNLTSKKNSLKPLKVLVDLGDPGWPIVCDWIQAAKVDVEVLEADLEDRKSALLETQVTTRSPMGALIYQTGGLLVDSSWLRILGAKSKGMQRSLPEWNRSLFPQFWGKGEPAPLLVVADDILGGLFAVNGGAFGPDLGNIYYFAPDTLAWNAMGVGYSEFFPWCLSGALQEFYAPLRWRGWQEEAKKLGGEKGITFYPFLFSQAESLESRQRKAANLTEIIGVNFEFQKKMMVQE